MQKYSTIIGVIELRLNNEGYRVVGKRYSIGSSTVTLIMNRFKELGLSIDDLKAMEPSKVEAAFYPPENLRKEDKPLPDFDAIHTRMLSMKHKDLSFLWLEYKKDHPDGYQLSRFYELYACFMKKNFGDGSVTMPVERIPGEKMFIDWVGDQPELLTDTSTGELQKVHVFTTTLGFSSCVYAEIFPDEKLQNFITGVVHALSFYGAVPKYLVPDNLRTAVTKHGRDELLLNTTFADLEEYYGAIVLPPPPRKPRGKPSIESHVRILETHLIEKLKEEIHTSLDELNASAREIVAAINHREFQKRSDIRNTRMDAFEKYDRPRMRSLPGDGFTICDYKYFLRVPDNYHLEYDGHYYSVFYSYHGEPAILKATMSEIRICDKNNKLICVHPRSYKAFPRYITTDEHMPAEHRYYKDMGIHDGAYYRRWASKYGPAMSTVIDRILRSFDHEEQAYNSCNGVLHLCDNVSTSFVDEAAQQCIDMNSCKYTYFRKALAALKSVNHDRNSATIPDNNNIRGRDSYQ